MAGETMRARNPAGHAGLINNLLSFFTALASFVESRVALFTKESKAALMQLLILAGCLVAAIVFFVLGYVFLITSAVVAVARLAQIHWIWVALATAGLHFLLTLACLLFARSKVTQRPYPELTVELQKDRQWLKSLDQTSRPPR